MFSAESTAVSVTIVSNDAELLRELAWTLGAFGYEVEAYNDWGAEVPWRWADRPAIQLLDNRERELDQAEPTSRRGGHFLYRVLIQDLEQSAGSGDDSHAHADDVIQFPVNTGELLSRLRAGARRVAQERKLIGQSLVDQQTGLLNRAGFLAKSARFRPTEAALMLVGIDAYPRILSEHGRHATRALSQGLSRTIEQQVTGGSEVFLLEPSVIGCWLPDATTAEAQEAADAVVQKFRGCNTLTREIRCCPSASAAVVEWDAESPEASLERGAQSLAHAKSFGGGEVVLAAEAEQEAQEWRRDIEDGALLRDIVAQDVMEPFPVVLPADEPRQNGTLRWLQTAWRQGLTPPPCLPLIEADGSLAGVVDVARVLQAEDQLPPASAHDPTTIRPDAALADVLGAFADSADGVLVVAQDSVPLGYIASDALTELFTEPVQAERYNASSTNDGDVWELATPLLSASDAPL